MTTDDFRRIALSLPGAEELNGLGYPNFCTGRKSFATIEDSKAVIRLTRDQQVNTGRQPIRRGGSTNLKIRDVKFDLAVQETEPLPPLPTGGRADVALYFPAVRPVLSARRALVTVTRFNKFGLDLSGNPLEPIFCAQGPILTSMELRLQCLDLIFGCSKLQGKAVRDAQCVAAVLFRGGLRLLKQSHNGLSCLV